MNRIYFYLIQNLDREQREEFDAELYAPPDGGNDTSEDRLMQALYEAAAREDDHGQPRDDLY